MNTETVLDSSPAAPVEPSFEYNKHSVGLYLGFKGIGLEYGYALNER